MKKLMLIVVLTLGVVVSVCGQTTQPSGIETLAQAQQEIERLREENAALRQELAALKGLAPTTQPTARKRSTEETAPAKVMSIIEFLNALPADARPKADGTWDLATLGRATDWVSAHTNNLIIQDVVSASTVYPPIHDGSGKPSSGGMFKLEGKWGQLPLHCTFQLFTSDQESYDLAPRLKTGQNVTVRGKVRTISLAFGGGTRFSVYVHIRDGSMRLTAGRP